MILTAEQCAEIRARWESAKQNGFPFESAILLMADGDALLDTIEELRADLAKHSDEISDGENREEELESALATANERIRETETTLAKRSNELDWLCELHDYTRCAVCGTVRANEDVNCEAEPPYCHDCWEAENEHINS